MNLGKRDVCMFCDQPRAIQLPAGDMEAGDMEAGGMEAGDMEARAGKKRDVITREAGCAVLAGIGAGLFLYMLMFGMNFGNGVTWTASQQQVMGIIAYAGLIGGPIAGVIAAIRMIKRK